MPVVGSLFGGGYYTDDYEAGVAAVEVEAAVLWAQKAAEQQRVSEMFLLPPPPPLPDVRAILCELRRFESPPLRPRLRAALRQALPGDTAKRALPLHVLAAESGGGCEDLHPWLAPWAVCRASLASNDSGAAWPERPCAHRPRGHPPLQRPTRLLRAANLAQTGKPCRLLAQDYRFRRLWNSRRGCAAGNARRG